MACTVHRPRAPMQLERCFSTIIRMLTLLVLETCHCRYVCKPPMATTLCEVSEFWYKETWLCRYLGEHGRSKHLLGPLFLL